MLTTHITEAYFVVHFDGPSRLSDTGGNPTSFPGNEVETSPSGGCVMVLIAFAQWRAARRRTER
jgi:hypothetical protein